MKKTVIESPSPASPESPRQRWERLRSEPRDLYSVSEFLGIFPRPISRQGLYNRLNKKTLPFSAVRVGRYIMFRSAEVDAYLGAIYGAPAETPAAQ